MTSFLCGALDAMRVAAVCSLLLVTIGLIPAGESQRAAQALFGSCPPRNACPGSCQVRLYGMHLTCTVSPGEVYGPGCAGWCGFCSEGQKCFGTAASATGGTVSCVCVQRGC